MSKPHSYFKQQKLFFYLVDFVAGRPNICQNLKHPALKRTIHFNSVMTSYARISGISLFYSNNLNLNSAFDGKMFPGEGTHKDVISKQIFQYSNFSILFRFQNNSPTFWNDWFSTHGNLYKIFFGNYIFIKASFNAEIKPDS